MRSLQEPREMLMQWRKELRVFYSSFSTRCEFNPIYFSLMKCCAASDGKTCFSFPVSWELCAPSFMEFSVEIRGSLDPKYLAFRIRTSCRRASKALTNSTEVYTSARSARIVILFEKERWVTSYWATVCEFVPNLSKCGCKLRTNYQQESRCLQAL